MNAVRLGAPAEWIVKSIQRYGSLSFPFVAEDGSAIAFWAGTVTTVAVPSGATLSTGERYRLEVRGETLTAFNVSQETYVRKSYRGSDADVSLRPLLLLDRYRTLCVAGESSSLFLARIDDRQRGPHPNLVRAIKVRGEVGSTGIEAVGTLSGKYLLEVMVSGKARYLEVDPNTLDYRWVKAPDWKSPLVSTRWDADAHFQKFVEGPFSQVVSSVNGAYAWAVDSTSGRHWLLQR